jgi:hypothetical protein
LYIGCIYSYTDGMARQYNRYTKELLQEKANQVCSVSALMRALGLSRVDGGSHSHISRRLRQLDVDTSHFTGKRTNAGPGWKGFRLPWQALLVKKTEGNRVTAVRLRRALIESGRVFECACCGISKWQGKPIMLQVDHTNRDWLDNRPENLTFLCPNCHSQTAGWCGSKGHVEVTSTAKYCRERRKERARAETVDNSGLEPLERDLV